jgi:DNA polymerase III delta subunit
MSLLALVISKGAFANEEIENLVAELGSSSEQEIIQLTYQSNPNLVLDILVLLISSENVDATQAIQTAMEVAPERAVEIAEIARQAGISNEDITTAALLAGIDPTLVGEATAAGIPAPVTTPPPLAAPSAPGAPSGGGGSSTPSVSPSA